MNTMVYLTQDLVKSQESDDGYGRLWTKIRWMHTRSIRSQDIFMGMKDYEVKLG